MSPYLSNHLEELKNCVLIAAGVKNPIPADCKLISILINKKTRQNISETTLKRIYGFAFSKFRPSLFTMNAMAQFCDYADWDDFYKQRFKALKVNNDGQIPGWSHLRQKANTVTGFTLQALKNKSGVPFSKTIKRDFIDYHISEFLNSGSTATVISAPAGCGKTIALCHWVEEKITADDKENNEDIVLFFSCNALMSAVQTGVNLNDWLLSLMGHTTNHDMEFFSDLDQRKNGNFFMIIDGLDEFMFKNDQFRIIVNQLFDVIAFYQSHAWFKLVLTMRTSTWVHNHHYMELNNHEWHTGFHANSNFINVPLFDLQEINALCYKINPELFKPVDIKTAELFTHPLYFQFYYKQHKENFSLSFSNQTLRYELIAGFILTKVYLSSQSSEKISFINALVDYIDVESGSYKINRLKVDYLIKQHPQAYLELISIGFLHEFNESTNFQYKTYIIFGNDNYLEYSIAQALLFKNDNKFNDGLMLDINTLFEHNKKKVDILKWCVIHTIKVDGLSGLEHVTEVNLNLNEKTSLITFIGELLERESYADQRNISLIKYFQQPLSDKIFQYFFGLELIDPNYKNTLSTLLKLELSPKRQIIVLTALGIIALIELNIEELEKIIIRLQSFDADEFNALPVNPLSCFDAYYCCLKYAVTKKEAIQEITKLYFKPLEQDNMQPNPSNDLLYLLAVHVLFLCLNPKKKLRLINFLQKNYRINAPDNYISQYDYFIKLHKSNALLDLGCKEKAKEIFKNLTHIFEDDRNLITPFMKISYHFLRIKVLMGTSQELLILCELKNISNIAERSGYKYLKLRTFTTLINDGKIKNFAPEFFRQISYEVNKISRDHGLNVSLFLESQPALQNTNPPG